MIHNISERRGRVSTCHGCLRKVTVGLVLAACLLFVTSAKAQTVDELDCHMHGTERWCIGPDGKESLYPFSTTVFATATSLPATTTTTVTDDHATETHTDAHDEASHTGSHDEATHTNEHDHAEETGLTNCHSHGSETWCTNEKGEEVLVPADEHTEDDHDHTEAEKDLSNGTDSPPTPENCHFHAGVEHCDNDEAITDPATQCVVSERDYNRKLRIGTIFIVLLTSSIAVFGPILLSRLTSLKYTGLVFTIIKQFGTGVIVATAYIHLLTHAQILFSNPCIGELGYEATSSAVAMAGIFAAFLVEYIGDRILQVRAKHHKNPGSVEDALPSAVVGKEDTGSNESEPHVHNHVHTHSHGAHSHGPVVNDKLAVLVMESGIIFHSILIGITLIVSGDSVFATLLVVVVFHQMFEGLALGTRIAMLPTACASLTTRLLLASAFACITPIGMGIGVGVLNKFNGNDRHTLLAMATLDAVSAGILVWVGVVEMWAADWLNGDMRSSGPVKTLVGLASLMGGMALMGLLGKWA